MGPTGSDAQAYDLNRGPTDPDAIDGPVIAPTLLGIHGWGPYLHDGSGTTLADAIDLHGGGLSDALTDGQLDELREYLATR